MKLTICRSTLVDPGNPLDFFAVELRDKEYELHRLFTDPVRGEMTHVNNAAIQSMKNLMTILKPAGASATGTSMNWNQVQCDENANSVTVMGVNSF